MSYYNSNGGYGNRQYQGGRSNYGGSSHNIQETIKPLVGSKLNPDTYVDDAEKVIKGLVTDKNGKPALTTSKIRKILTMTADIYNSVMSSTDEDLSSELKLRIDYLRVQLVYECGRDDDKRNQYPVKDFIEKANLIGILKAQSGKKDEIVLFNRYMEALVAYHKFYGGKDN